MALDVYVGSLTRYYTRDWENVMQREARLTGQEYHMITPGGDQGPPPTAEKVQPVILAWQEALTKGLGDSVPGSVTWNESPDGPYFTDRPGYAGYSALVTWAVYAGSRDTAPPPDVPEDWTEDPLFEAAVEKDSGTPYRQILQPEIWIPTPLEFVFMGPSPLNEPAWIGSAPTLFQQLSLLNEQTFAASDAELERYLNEEIEAESELEHGAKFALALFRSLAQKAVEAEAPMLLDG